MKKFGFTLIEVLLTMSIIGVVAALTVPNVVSNYQKKSYVTQLHKVYNDLDRVINKYMADERIDNLKDASIATIDISGLTSLIDFVNENFTVVEHCGFDLYKDDKCFSKTYDRIDDNSTITTNNIRIASDYYLAFKAKSGVTFCIALDPSENDVFTIFVDTNGTGDPNILGRDFFTDIKIRNDGQVYSNDGYFHNILNANWKMNY